VVKIESLFSELHKGVEQLKIVQQQLKRYRQSVLKAAFEGKLTAAWRAEQQAGGTLPTAEDLLAQIKAERDTRYQQQLADWQQAVKDWESAGSKSKKSRKPGKLKDLPSLTKDELASLSELPEGWQWLTISWL
jgi:type I restriction enzyme S subunit